MPNVRSKNPRSRGALVAACLLTLSGVGRGVDALASDKPLDAKLVDLEGNKVKLAELRGTPVLLELWASWCLPCRKQAEIVRGLAEEFDQRGIEVYAVNVGEDRKVVEKHLASDPSANPVLLDRWQTISTRLEIPELPALVLLDSDGAVTATAVGLTDRERLVAMLDQLGEGDVVRRRAQGPDATHAGKHLGNQ